MDELSESGKELLRKVLSRGRVAYDSLSEDERRAVDELLRLGYVRLYVEPNSKRLGDALRLVAPSGTLHGRFSHVRYINYLCLALVLLMPSLSLYLTVRSLMMGYTSVGALFLVITLGLAYVAYLVIRGRRCRVA